MVEKQAEDDDQLIAKIRRFLEEKENLDLQSMYFITKRFNEILWDEIQDLDEDEVEEDDEEDFGDFEDVIGGENPELEEVEEPKKEEKRKTKKTKPVIKKPKIKLLG